MYCCQPMVKVFKGNGESVSIQIPTFYLDTKVQGIVNERHAETIVTEICNPTFDKNIVVSPNVTHLPA